jgi:hypothetical protein
VNTKHIKTAAKNYNVMDLIKSRFNAGAFSDKAFTPHYLNIILETVA